METFSFPEEIFNMVVNVCFIPSGSEAKMNYPYISIYGWICYTDTSKVPAAQSYCCLTEKAG